MSFSDHHMKDNEIMNIQIKDVQSQLRLEILRLGRYIDGLSKTGIAERYNVEYEIIDRVLRGERT